MHSNKRSQPSCRPKVVSRFEFRRPPRAKFDRGMSFPLVLLGVVLIFLFGQWIAGAAYFKYQCSLGQGFQVYGRPTENSIAIVRDKGDDPVLKGCSTFCFRDLLNATNRMAFLEILIDDPDLNRLSEKSGWYRYEILPYPDARCMLFRNSPAAQAEFAEIARRTYGSSFSVGEYCVGATAITNLQSTSEVVTNINHAAAQHLGVRTETLEFRNRESGKLYAVHRATSYAGPHLYLLLTSIYVDSRTKDYCPGPRESALAYMHSFRPKSDLPPIIANSEATK